jgi:hypothetical protein
MNALFESQSNATPLDEFFSRLPDSQEQDNIQKHTMARRPHRLLEEEEDEEEDETLQRMLTATQSAVIPKTISISLIISIYLTTTCYVGVDNNLDDIDTGLKIAETTAPTKMASNWC